MEKNSKSEKSDRIEINDMVLSFIKEPLITAIVPIRAYVDMMKSEQFGQVNDIQKEKLYVMQKQIDILVSKITDLSIEKLENIKHENI